MFTINSFPEAISVANSLKGKADYDADEAAFDAAYSAVEKAIMDVLYDKLGVATDEEITEEHGEDVAGNVIDCVREIQMIWGGDLI